ncbi:protein serine/threonine phosphatase 2C [Wolfiporia cocos MD-104 SS10]|uniref:Protein serine/threonine phosphatase 2C n=1 Tax=Wolfiporia cocos (strain MD-104) TaxID=742152 RepID=A0A2H3JF72_WOLCO|nr:protein serine/threonine phosphatase 2C [Wolfiporia cocos MD-104 SS10]
MLKRAWKPFLVTTTVIGVPAYYYYRYSAGKPTSETFDLPIRSRDSSGKVVMTSRTFPLLSKEQADARLSEHATFKATPRPDGLIWKHATAYVASNSPIEDAYASALIPRNPSDRAYPGDLLFYAILDGHGGYDTSRLLSQVLIPAVTLELHQLRNGSSATTSSSGGMQYLRSLLYPTPNSSLGPLDADPERVAHAIQTAFINLDQELTSAPLRILAEHADKLAIQKGAIPDLSQHPMALASMLPAMSGSCAIMALFDTAHQNLYVACTGDCRAVAGVYEETEDGKGSWRVEVLSEDQTGENPNEIKRVQSEHPRDERDSVIRRGRVLGGLQPTRAFGDARYKWSREVQEILSKAFLHGNDHSMRAAPAALRTPPYVTSRPEVTHRKFSFLPSSDSPTKPKSALRFVVLATDGLWDELTSEEVVALVGGHLMGLKGTVPKTTLPSVVRTTIGTPTLDGKNIKREEAKGAWAFVDENVGTHLIRNALGGANEEKLRELLSIPAPYSRNHRDDITVTVVWWEDGREKDVGASTSGDQKVRSKL